MTTTKQATQQAGDHTANTNKPHEAEKHLSKAVSHLDAAHDILQTKSGMPEEDRIESSGWLFAAAEDVAKASNRAMDVLIHLEHRRKEEGGA